MSQCAIKKFYKVNRQPPKPFRSSNEFTAHPALKIFNLKNVVPVIYRKYGRNVKFHLRERNPGESVINAHL